MKKLFYTLALVVLGIATSYAQRPSERPAPRLRTELEKLTPEQRAEKAANAMQKKLSLTADQKQKIQQIELDRIKKNDEWRKQDEKAIKGKMEERRTFAKASQDKIAAILTEEQKKTLASSRDEMRERLKDRRADRAPRAPRGGRPGDGPPPPPEKN